MLSFFSVLLLFRFFHFRPRHNRTLFAASWPYPRTVPQRQQGYLYHRIHTSREARTHYLSSADWQIEEGTTNPRTGRNETGTSQPTNQPSDRTASSKARTAHRELNSFFLVVLVVGFSLYPPIPVAAIGTYTPVQKFGITP